MHFLRSLVFSAVVYASAAFAASHGIPVGNGDEATANLKDTEIDIKMHYEQPAEVLQQLVFPSMINSPLNTHIHVIALIYAFSNLKLHTSKSLTCRKELACSSNGQCVVYGCSSCGSDKKVSLARALE